MSIAIESEMRKWAGLHERLQDMLAGYADNELDTEQTDLVEAHLAGCQYCRDDLARQRILIHRLETISPPRVSAELHQRFDQMLLDVSALPQRSTQQFRWPFLIPLRNWLKNLSKSFILGSSGWAVALVLAIVILLPSLNQRQNSRIPMIRDALAQYDEMEGRALPVAMAGHMPKAPVTWPNAHLLATWNTNVAGAPAQVYAFRSGKNIVFQYHVDESVFFRNPAVRQAIAKSGKYKMRSYKTDVLAVPLSNAGIIVIGPADSLPELKQMKFKAT